MATQSLPPSGRVRATSGHAVAALSSHLAPAHRPKLAITGLIRSMEAEIEEYIAEQIG